MGLMSWFKSVAFESPIEEFLPNETGGPPGHEEADAGTEEAMLSGLDFKAAIDAHMAWKVRLERCLENDNEEKLEVATVSRDDRCELGVWIHGAGGRDFGHLREFQEMKLRHSQFHLCAGDVLSCCLAGDKEGAAQKLRSRDYTRASERVKLHLARLYVQATQEQGEHPVP